ncbi:MAG: cytochrome P450, partial [Cyanobacteria bacterium P01_H01_bin.130]
MATSFVPLPPPPSTDALVLWQTLRWVLSPLSLLDESRDRLGDLFSLNRNGVIISGHPDHIREIFERDGQALSTPGHFNRILQPLLGEQSLLLLGSKPHRRRRKLLMPPFHGKALQSYGTTIQAIAQDVFQQWQPGQRLIARDAAQELTLRVIMETVFGLQGGDRYTAMGPLMEQMTGMTATPARSMFLFFPTLQRSWGPWGNFERSRAALDRLIYQELADRRAMGGDANANNRQDILSLLLATEDEYGHPLTDGELRDELMTLLFAGHETTATAIAWGMYWLHANPHCLAKLREELDALPDDAPPMDLLKLPYLK